MASSGPNNPALGENISGTGADWYGATSIYSSDDSRAFCVVNYGSASNYLRVTHFGFAIPTGAVINGIKAEFERSQTTPNEYIGTIRDSSIKLVKAAVETGTNNSAAAAYPTTDAYTAFGGTTDLWGETWTAADINSDDFGVSCKAGNSGGSANAGFALVDHVRITVYYTAPVSGSFTANAVLTTSAAHGQFIGNAILKKSRSGSFKADAALATRNPTTQIFNIIRSGRDIVLWLKNKDGAGLVSRYPSMVRLILPQVPDSPTGTWEHAGEANENYNITLTLPANATDVWGVEIRAADQITPLYQYEDILLSITPDSPALKWVYDGTILQDLYAYCYNLLNEYSPGCKIDLPDFHTEADDNTFLVGPAANPTFTTLTTSHLPSSVITREFCFTIGSDSGSALADADDKTSVFVNRLGQSITITEVWADCDGGTPIIQLQKDDGSVTDMLSSNLTVSTGSGASTTDFISGENILATGDRLDFKMVTAGGVAKRVTVGVKYTVT